MDDLTKKLNDLLSSPDSMEKIRSAMAAMGLDDGEEESKSQTSSPSASPEAGIAGSLQAMLAGLAGNAASEKSSPKENGGGLDLAAIAKLAPLLSGMNKDDENTILLKALRPYLHGDREKRLDDAIQMMKLMKLLPLLQDQGLTGGK